MEKNQVRNTRIWRHRHPQRSRYLNYKAVAKLFIIKYASHQDLVFIQKLVNLREKKLRK